jgi:hypothetical protein
VTEGDKGVLLKCWAGCTIDEIARSLGLRLADLFSDTPQLDGKQSVVRQRHSNHRALAFRFELCALDLRLRADRVLEAISHVRQPIGDDSERDRLLSAVASAYRDRERANLFECVADTLQWKASEGRAMHHAA